MRKNNFLHALRSFTLVLFLLLARPCFGYFVYVADFSNKVFVLDTTQNNAIVAAIDVGIEPTSLAVTPDGTRIYVTNNSDSTVSVIDGNPSSRGVIKVITVGIGPNPNAVAISPDGKFAYVGNGDGSINVIDTSTNTVKQSITGSSAVNINALTVTPDGKELYAALNANLFEYFTIASDGTLTFGNTIGDRTPQVITSAVTPNGQFVFSGTDSFGLPPPTFLDVINTTTHLINPEIAILQGLPSGIAVSPNGEFVYVSSAGEFSVFKTSDYSLLTHIDYPSAGGINGPIAFTPDGLSAYVANSQVQSNHVDVIDTNPLSPTYNTVVADIGPFGLFFFDIAIGIVPSSPSPSSSPTNLTGAQKKNDFGLLFELFNQLQWESSSTSVAGFNVYRNGALIASLGPSTFTYQDHNRKRGVTTTYSVTAVSSSGSESVPATISIP